MHCTILVKQWQSPKVYTDTPQELALLKLRDTTVIKISQVFPILAFSKAGRLLQKKKMPDTLNLCGSILPHLH